MFRQLARCLLSSKHSFRPSQPSQSVLAPRLARLGTPTTTTTTTTLKTSRSTGTLVYHSLKPSSLPLSPLACSRRLMSSSAGVSGTSADTPDSRPTNVKRNERNEGIQEPVEVVEGQAKILFNTKNDVFYNKVQCANRDVSKAVIKQFIKEHREAWATKREKKPHLKPEVAPVRFLEALGATGLRSIRYSKEIPELDHITANDLDIKAVEAMKRNMEHNGITEERMSTNHSDAVSYLHTLRPGVSPSFEIIDLDPYGSPHIFLDGAVQAVQEGGLLCVTATDLAVLAGAHSDVCYVKYGASSLRSPYTHETALRILLGCIQTHANRHKRVIEPLVSLSLDFYVRVFVRVRTSADKANHTRAKMAMQYQCMNCNTHYHHPLGRLVPAGKKKQSVKCTSGIAFDKTHCPNCGGRFHVAGPVWNDPIHNKDFVKGVLSQIKDNPDQYATHNRLTAVLSTVEQEMDVSGFYLLDTLCSSVKAPPMKIERFRSAILNAGYAVSPSHCKPGSMKTNAPPEVIYDIVRAHAKESGKISLGDSTVADRILGKEMGIQVNFSHHPDARRQCAGPMYMPNPEAYWGPAARAKTSRSTGENEEMKAKRRKIVCVHWANTGKCEFGDKCKYAHEHLGSNSLEEEKKEAGQEGENA